MEQSPWETNCHSASQEIPHLWFIIVFTRAHNWSYPEPCEHHYTHSRPFSLKSIVILSSHLHLGIPSSLFTSDFPTKTLHTLFICPMCGTWPAYLIILDFDHPNNIWWSTEVMKLVTVQPSSLLPLPLRFKYSHHPILRHPQSMFFP